MAENPLAWPDGWPRTPVGQREDGRSRFAKVGGEGGKRPITLSEAEKTLLDACSRLGATHVVITSNLPVGMKGQLMGVRGALDDGGVSVYFTLRGKEHGMARDAFVRIEDNIRSLALALEAMAQLERHGGGVMVEKAFQGFAALPPPEPTEPQRRPWWLQFDYSQTEPSRSAVDREIIDFYYRRAVKAHMANSNGQETVEAQQAWALNANLTREDAYAWLEGGAATPAGRLK